MVLPDDCYQGVAGLVSAGATRGRWTVDRLPMSDTAAWVDVCRNADLLWLESPSNPLLEVADLEAICGAPRKATAVVAVDNTFATPLNQPPLDYGATISIQSAIKFIGGHSDLLAGIATTKDYGVLHQLKKTRELTGATPGTLASFLAVRGARTLALRLERAQASAGLLAERLEADPRVSLVRYPGLASHPTHETAQRVLKGSGTVISFDVAGDAAAADAVCRRIELIHHATGLGAVESTMERRAAIPGQEHLPPSLLRLSVGVEHVDDIWADLDRALGGR